MFCGAALPALGISNLLNFIVTLMPSPVEKAFPKRGTNPKTNEPAERVCSVDEPFSAQVFKTLADPFVGKISLIKIISGVLTPNTQFTNANIEKTAKAGSISTMCGKKLTPSFKLIAGDIGVRQACGHQDRRHALRPRASHRLPVGDLPRTQLLHGHRRQEEG